MTNHKWESIWDRDPHSGESDPAHGIALGWDDWTQAHPVLAICISDNLATQLSLPLSYWATLNVVKFQISNR